MRRFLAGLALLLLAALPAQARFFAGAANNGGGGSPTLTFTALSNGTISSTILGSGAYTGAAPSGLTVSAWTGTCTGTPTISGFTDGGGLWSASFSTPSSACSGTLTVTGTGSNTATSGASPTATISAQVVFTALHTYFISPTGNDSTGTGTSGNPWLTPNHTGFVCGDVVINLSGTISGSGYQNFGTVSAPSCPSTTGGIDGAGGISYVMLVCGNSSGTADLTSCPVPFTGGGWAMDVKTNHWLLSGFQVSGNSGQGAFVADGAAATVSYIAFVNNVAFNVGIGFGGLDNGTSHDKPGATGFDHVAYVGNIAENAEQNTVCTAAMPMAGPATVDAVAGTHFLWYGNYAWNQGNNGCGSDIENFFMDTPDAHGVTSQVVWLDNIGWSAYRFGLAMFVQNFNSVTGLTEIAQNNTLVNNNLINAGGNGDLNVQMDNSSAPTITSTNNIAQSTQSSECGALVGGANGPTSLANITMGTSGNQNFFFNSNGGSNTCAFNGFSFGSNNFTVTPSFTNLTDLLTNRSGAPNCAGFQNTAQCMGYDAQTSTLTTPSVISDLVPTASNTGGKGYQLPTTTPTANALYPAELKGGVYLHWTGSQLIEEPGLVTKPTDM